MLEKQFKKNINDLGLDIKDQRFLLTISGGIDSMVLLHLFSPHNDNIVVAHVNHGLRPQESAKEEKLVQNYCQSKRIQVEVLHLDGKTNGENIQIWARNCRYEWFHQLVKTHQLDFIVTAHHLDDNIETLFFNLIRGTGLAGLTGMPLLAEIVLRPLISIPRSDIAQYAEDNKVPYLHDSSNDSTKYSRNHIRKNILPQAAILFPNYRHRVERTRKNLISDATLLDELVSNLSKEIMGNEGAYIILDKDKLLSFDHADLLLFRMIKRYGFTYDQSRNIILRVHKRSKKFESDSHKLTIETNRFVIQENIFESTDNQGNTEIFLSDLPLKLKFNNISYTLAEKKASSYHAENLIASIDLDNLNFPLTLRKWKPGDFFYPLGMGGKRKKVKDFLRDLKVEYMYKMNVQVLCSRGDIVYVSPYRISENYKVTNATQRILSFTQD